MEDLASVSSAVGVWEGVLAAERPWYRLLRDLAAGARSRARGAGAKVWDSEEFWTPGQLPLQPIMVGVGMERV